MVRTYVGTGPRAEIAAAGDMLQWLDRYQKARAAAEAREFETELLVFDALCNAIARDEQEAAGYHQHRGQWRKRRIAKPRAAAPDKMTAPAPEPANESWSPRTSPSSPGPASIAASPTCSGGSSTRPSPPSPIVSDTTRPTRRLTPTAAGP